MMYFIYKQINITNIGGISIPTIEGINGGQGSYGEWLLGTVDDPNKLLLIKEFAPRIVDENVWRGYNLIGKTEIIDNSDPSNPVTRPLTETEITQQKAAVNWEYKENARLGIETNVGDTLKQVAQVDQQLQLITPVVVRMYKLVLALFTHLSLTILVDILPVDTKVQYDTFTDMYLGLIASGQFKDRIDVDPRPDLLIQDMLTNIGTIAGVLKTEYLDKKI